MVERDATENTSLNSPLIQCVEKNDEKAQDEKLKWSCMRILTVFNILFSSFMEGTLYMFLASFFPKTALDRGLSKSTVGLIFAAFPISTVSISFFSGYLLRIMSARTMFLSSYILTGAALIPFMFSNDIQSLELYCIFCFFCRIVHGIGGAGIKLSGMTILTTNYKPWLSTFIGAYGMTYGVGAAFGPFLSSYLYKELGYKGPFLVMTYLIALTVVFSFFFLLENNTPADKEKNESINVISKIKAVPEIIFINISMILTTTYFSFRDMILTVYIMKTFGLDIVTASSYLMIEPIVFSICAPITGIIVDKGMKPIKVYVFGSFFLTTALFLLGPAPFFNIKPSLPMMTFFLILSGLSVGIKHTPRLSVIYDVLSFRNLEVTTSWMNFVNAGMMASTTMGSLIGPSIGGIIVQYTNYAWTQTIFGFVELLMLVVLMYLMMRKKKK